MAEKEKDLKQQETVGTENDNAVENKESISPEEAQIKKYKSTSIATGILSVVLFVFCLFMFFSGSSGLNSNMDTVEKDDKVTVDMMVTENGKKNDDRSFTDVLISVNKDSFSEEIINTLIGMKAGETKSVTIKETLLKDGVDINDIPEEAYQDGSASKYYEEKDVKYTFKVKTIWKYSSDITKKDTEEQNNNQNQQQENSEDSNSDK